MRLNVNPQRMRRQRPVKVRWTVRRHGVDVYAGESAGEAWTWVRHGEPVSVYLNGRQVWPPADELPIGHL